MGIQTDQISVKIVGAQGTEVAEATERVVLHISVPDSNKPIKAAFFVVSKITAHLPNSRISQSKYPEFSRLKLADPQYGTPAEIEALFGVRIWIKILLPNIVRTKDQLGIAQQTKLGYVIFQAEKDSALRISKHQINTALVNHLDAKHTDPQPDQLHQLLQRFWEIEDLPRISFLSPEEKECERIFNETHFRRSDGRFVVRMPLNDKINLLGKSKRDSLMQFFAMERKMARDPDFRNEYIKYMKTHEDNGFMELIHEKTENGCYIPHHGVSRTVKFRVVTNASKPTTTGISLNECQLVGPKLQRNLADTLMCFRTHRSAICADIKAMYSQVEIHDDHKKYQKLLWRDSPDKPVGVYQFNRVAFGQACAPYLAIKAVQQCAKDHEQEFPRGAKATMECFYVDDFFSGADTIEEARDIQRETTQLLARGKFELTKWCSNEPRLNKPFKSKPRAVDIQEEETKSVLGLQWLPLDDDFMFKITELPKETRWTKRNVLSQIGKLYDPNGFIAPAVIIAKMFIQTLWKDELDWDEPLPQQLVDEWEEFHTSIHFFRDIAIPRWLGTANDNVAELHGFCDASERAYAAVVYVRAIWPNGMINSNIVQSKTRVAPLKTVTVPRLELCGAYLLTKLMSTIQDAIGHQISKTFYWSDSEIVLQWITKSPSDLKTFVANRVATIQYETINKGHKWHWVPTAENPADLASRGVMPHSLQSTRLWWHGPEWLQQTEDRWPTSITRDLSHFLNPQSHIDQKEVYAEVKSMHMIAEDPLPSVGPLIRGKWSEKAHTVTSPLMSTYSSFNRLIRVVAYVKRAFHNFKCRLYKKFPKYKNEPIFGPLSPGEKEEAKFYVSRLDQQEFLTKEWKLYQNRNSNAYQTRDGNLWFDEKSQLLRLYGRVSSSNLTYDERYPIYLSSKGRLAKLLLQQVHAQTLHGGVQQMLQLLRQQFWIPKARRLASQCIYSCTRCFRFKMKVASQLMAALPAERTMPIRPFRRCGVDYAGPVGIVSRTGRNPQITKGYISLFVCFVTRAIHLELVSDLSTPQFIQALRRFIARRGAVSEIWSDNGTNFVGANSYIQKVLKLQKADNTADVVDQFNIKWHFIVPSAPSWGGLWEAGVKSVKKHLVRVIGTQNLTFEEYSTLLAQVEACVNSRPIAPLSDDPNDLTALTPGHFLIGESLITLPEPCAFELDKPTHYLKRWEMVQHQTQHIWKRWHDEYISSIMTRSKWKKQTRNFQINDLVIIKEDNMPPSRWRLGRILEVFPSSDGLVRAVRLRTKDGEYSRPITKLALLVNNEDDSELNPELDQIPTQAG